MDNRYRSNATTGRNLFGVIFAMIAIAGMSWTASAQPTPEEPLKLSYGDLTAKVWAPLVPPPAIATVFAVDPGVVPIGLDELQDTFNVTGPAHDALFPRGAKHVANGSFHILFMTDGAGEYTDTHSDHLGNIINPMPEDDLWDASDELLSGFGVLDGPLFSMTREEMLKEPCDNCSSPALSRQQALYRQNIDGLPTFGEGSVVSVRFAGDDVVVGFTHAVRGLSPHYVEKTLEPQLALMSWLKRIVDGEEWTEIGDNSVRPDALDVTKVKMGYLIPAFGERAVGLQPCYAIQAIATTYDTAGNPVRTPVRWYEPALVRFGSFDGSTAP